MLRRSEGTAIKKINVLFWLNLPQHLTGASEKVNNKKPTVLRKLRLPITMLHFPPRSRYTSSTTFVTMDADLLPPPPPPPRDDKMLALLSLILLLLLVPPRLVLLLLLLVVAVVVMANPPTAAEAAVDDDSTRFPVNTLPKVRQGLMKNDPKI